MGTVEDVTEPHVPDLSTLRQLHNSLLHAYTHIAQDTSRFDPARPYLLGQVRENATRLRTAYRSALQSEQRDDVHDWMTARAADLDGFIQDLDASRGRIGHLLGLAKKGWTVAGSAYTALVMVMAPPIFVASLSALAVATFEKCFCEVFRFGFPVLLLCVLAIGVGGFLRKRARLLGGAAGSPSNSDKLRPNTYELEQKLLRELDAPRHGEFQWDGVTFFVLAALTVIARFVTPLLHTDRQITFYLDPFYQAGFWAAIGVIWIVGSTSRRWGWRPAL